MKRYPKYKPFGNYWISEIPSHWNEQKIKHLFDERVEKGHPDEPLLAATQNQGVILKSDYESRTVEATKDLHLLKFVKEGDFVISLRSFQGGIEYSYCQGIISPAYTIMIPRPEIDSSYFRHLAKSRTFIELLKGCVTGIREGQNINYALLRTYLLPLPPLDEQKAIADYLDKKMEQIDRFISLQKEAISLLKELRQAEITKAVTKGLDENAEMKDSGVEWIGEIPSEWNVIKLSHIFRTIGSGTTPISGDSESYDNGNIAWINSGDLNDKHLLNTCHKVTESAIKKYSALKIYPKGTLFVAMYGANIGKICISDIEACCNQACCGLTNLISTSTLSYIFYQLLACREYWMLNAQGGGQKNINMDIVRSTRLLLPPLNIQENIADYLDQKCAEIDSAIQNKEALIEKVTEYKIRLISDAVTGKIDVREEDIKP